MKNDRTRRLDVRRSPRPPSVSHPPARPPGLLPITPQPVCTLPAFSYHTHSTLSKLPPDSIVKLGLNPASIFSHVSLHPLCREHPGLPPNPLIPHHIPTDSHHRSTYRHSAVLCYLSNNHVNMSHVLQVPLGRLRRCVNVIPMLPKSPRPVTS